MSEVETKKGRGRPPSNRVKSDDEPKKRVSAENGDAPKPKRGRGRPPKKVSARKLVVVTEKADKGRGRPAKGNPVKKKSDEEEEDEDEDENENESS